ncbi:MAG: anaerobic ribonucleoside-triphosphate reductase activating protein [Muribaculaceae bacterium]|nr:anaerobic ribonucleoside-triphosphate reductase activating protein [Muribaculaceae bacterium]
MNYLRVLDIVEGTSVDGPGLRTSIYLAGCAHHCQGCHNPESWDFNGGNEMDDDRLMEVIAYNDFNVTFSGGDPMGQPEALARLCRRIKAELGKTIWVYTGYRWEQIIGREPFKAVLDTIDVLVDSPFILSRRDTTLRFRGSDNQRIIDVPSSLEAGEIVEMKMWDV